MFSVACAAPAGELLDQSEATMRVGTPDVASIRAVHAGESAC